jgi:hypothetical protein
MAEQLPITIDEWSDDGVKLLRYRARVDLSTIGFPLFDIYVKADATVFLRLRHGAQVLKEHRPIPWQEAMKLREGG